MSGRADFGKGSPADPMTDDELEAKFRDCAAWGGFGEDDARAVAALLWRLSELADVREITRLLRRSGVGA